MTTGCMNLVPFLFLLLFSCFFLPTPLDDLATVNSPMLLCTLMGQVCVCFVEREGGERSESRQKSGEKKADSTTKLLTRTRTESLKG